MEMAELAVKMAEELAIVAARIPTQMSFRDLGQQASAGPTRHS